MFKHRLIKRALANGLVIAAASFPAAAAQARYVEDPGGSSGAVPVAPPVASEFARSHPAATSGSSFQWGDAGIGAAGAAVLLGAGVVVGASTTRHRRRRVIS